MEKTIIQRLGYLKTNMLYIKREDLIPYSFGGNKVRKGLLFFDDINRGRYDCVVTYGGSHSNHCRVIANMAAARRVPCYIIGPDTVSDPTFNSYMMKMFGADIITVPLESIHDTIEQKLENLKGQGKKPYFVPGGGHGNIGTEAYVQCYKEIREYEEEHNTHFGYIFFASGTGTTQAGLVCGQLLHNDDRTIVGISIARKNPYGKRIVFDSIRSYMKSKKMELSDDRIGSKLIFIDDFIGAGYGKNNSQITQTIKEVMTSFGIPLDSTYTAKAFFGMEQYIVQKNIKDQSILFLHTGGTPLYFDDMNQFNLSGEQNR